MKSVTSAYLTAVSDYGREWNNKVTLTKNGTTETYYDAEITIEEVFSESDTLSMGKAFTKELKLKLKEPTRSISYNTATIVVTSRLKVDDSYVSVAMGTFFPSKVETSDDYATLDITAYDLMATLEEEYEPTVTLPCADSDIINDICTQKGITLESGTSGQSYITYDNQLLDFQYAQNGTSEGSEGTCELSKWADYHYSVELTDGEYYDGATDGGIVAWSSSTGVTLQKGHKYCLTMYCDGLADSFCSAKMYDAQEVGEGNFIGNTRNILTMSATKTVKRIEFLPYVDIDSHSEFDIIINLIDLTKMCGSGREPTSYSGTNGVTTIFDITTFHTYNTGTTPVVHGTSISAIVSGTIKDQLGWLAGVQGKNAIFNSDNELEFRWYTTPPVTTGTTWSALSGIAWQNATGTWSSYSPSISISRASQKENGLKLDESDFTISSITSGTEENSFTSGTGKGISFYDPYITQAQLTTIASSVLNSSYRTGSVETFGNPAFEVGDALYVIDKEGASHAFYLSNITWNLSGGCNSSYTSVGNPDATIEFDTPTAKTLLTKNTTLKDQIAKFSELINNENGYYTITEENGVATGWTIKDDITNPQKMVKASLGGIGYSSDGGVTYNNALTGEGIVANSITSGTLTLGGVDDDTILQIQNTSAETIGEWNATGLTTLYSRTFLQSNYSQTDRDRISDIIVGTITPTSADYEKYDFYGRGIISVTDSVICRDLVNGTYGTYVKITWQINIHPTDQTAAFEITCKRTPQSGSETTLQSTKISGSSVRSANAIFGTDSVATSTAYALYVSGKGYATGGFSGGSARKLKENIEPYTESAIDKINDIDIVSFNLKDDESKATKVGFIADDTDELFATQEHNAIDYNNCIGMLLKAVQELSQEVESLKQQLEEGGNESGSN